MQPQAQDYQEWTVWFVLLVETHMFCLLPHLRTWEKKSVDHTNDPSYVTRRCGSATATRGPRGRQWWRVVPARNFHSV
jgi:hypothetical protein